MVQVRHEQIHPAVLIVVGRIYTHARTRFSSGAIGDTGSESNFFKALPLAIRKQEISSRIVGNKKVQESIVVDVRSDDTPSLARIIGDSHLLAYVCECSVPVVVKQPARHGVKDTRITVFVKSCKCGYIWRFAHVVLHLAEIDEAANEEIETPIIVIIKPHGAGGPTGGCDTSFFRDIRECAVTVVVIKDAAAVLSDIEIGETIPVIIADGCPHAIAAAHDA